MKMTMITAATLMAISGTGWSLGAPEPSSCLQTQFQHNGWGSEITITNHCQNAQGQNEAISLQDALVQFHSNEKLTGSFWGNFGNMAYPENHSMSSQADGDGFAVSMSLAFPKGNQWWKPKNTLDYGKSVSLQFSTRPTTQVKSVKIFTNQPTPPTQLGELDMSLPAAPEGAASQKPVLVIQGDNGYKTTVKEANWSSSYDLKSLPYGEYQIQVGSIETSSAVFEGKASPNPISINSKTPGKVSVSFEKAVSLGSISLNLAQQQGDIGTKHPVLQLKNLSNGKSLPDIQLTWNAKVNLPNLIAGDTYALSANTLSSQYDQFTPQFSPSAQVKISPNSATNVSLTYQKSPVTTASVTADISGLPQGEKSTVSFKDSLGYTFSSNPMVNGSNLKLSDLPVGRLYTVSANTVDHDKQSYGPTITPNSFTLKATGPQKITLNYSAQASRFVAYWAGWSAIPLDQLANTKVDVVNLSFADVRASGNSYKIDTSVSGYIADLPAAGSQLWPSYQRWTSYAFAHPDTEFLLSVGGATFSQIWTNVLTPHSVDAIADALVAKLNTDFPVYQGDRGYYAANPAMQIGSVKIAGIDIDPEAGGARLSEQQADNIVALIKAIRAKAPNTIITLAGFSVGAAPSQAACTVPGSAHCGEAVPILEKAGKDLNWVNVMAYDAGVAYAQENYKQALAHYASYVGKSKTYLGLDLQPQWGVPQPETPEQLAAKAKWAQDNGYGGSMLWAILNSNPSAYVYLDKISEALD